DPGRPHLADYTAAGVIAYLFGQAQDGATCACDAAGDGVTNPDPIGSNIGWSLSADDDGGFFRAKAAAYYAGGAIPLTPILALSANGTALGAGNRFELTATIANPGPAAIVDVYFGAVLPSSTGLACPARDPVVFLADGFTRVSVSCVSAPSQTFAPLTRRVTIPAAIQTSMTLISLVWPAGAPSRT